MAFAENLCEDATDKEDETHEQLTKRFIYENAMIVAPKIMSVAGCESYVLEMENAAIIRTNCRQMMEQIGFAVLMGSADPAHKQVIEEVMIEFRELFKNWVASFRKDEYEDEWGLFI